MTNIIEKYIETILKKLEKNNSVIKTFKIGTFFLGVNHKDIDLFILLDDLKSFEKINLEDIFEIKNIKSKKRNKNINIRFEKFNNLFDILFVDDFSEISYFLKINSILDSSKLFLESYLLAKEKGEEDKNKFLSTLTCSRN